MVPGGWGGRDLFLILLFYFVRGIIPSGTSINQTLHSHEHVRKPETTLDLLHYMPVL